MKKIILTGGSGFIGTQLAQKLVGEGYQVCIIDIAQPKIINEHISFIKHDIVKDELNTELLEGVFGIIHLAGAPIFHRWTPEYKKIIRSSRIDSTKNIVSAISKCSQYPQVFVCASAVGYYGDSPHVLTENSPQGYDFLSGVCVEWESEALKAEQFGVRVVCVRTAHVLGKGGILGVVVPLFKKWIGGYFGSGNYFMPWVHYKDIISIYSFALTNPLSGSYNTSAGAPVTQKQLMRSIAHSVGSPVVWRIPLFMLRIIFGELSSIFTVNQKVTSEKIKSAGYIFKYEDLKDALHDVLSS